MSTIISASSNARGRGQFDTSSTNGLTLPRRPTPLSIVGDTRSRGEAWCRRHSAVRIIIAADTKSPFNDGTTILLWGLWADRPPARLACLPTVAQHGLRQMGRRDAPGTECISTELVASLFLSGRVQVKRRGAAFLLSRVSGTIT